SALLRLMRSPASRRAAHLRFLGLPSPRVAAFGDLFFADVALYQLRIDMSDEETHGDTEPDVARLAFFQDERELAVDLGGGQALRAPGGPIDVEKPVRVCASTDIAIAPHIGTYRSPQCGGGIDVDPPLFLRGCFEAWRPFREFGPRRTTAENQCRN